MNYFKKIDINVVYLAAAVIIAGFCIYLNLGSPVVKDIKNDKRINCLLIGTDLVDYARHSDTIILLSYEPRTRFADVLSIPRDTRIKMEGYNLRRINSVFAYYYKKTGSTDEAARKLCKVVEVMLSSGTVSIEIPYYAVVNYQSFREMIDMLGGVTVRIDEAMHYDDFHGGLHIDFKPGVHHLNGTKALDYVRYRDETGDRGRIYRQQRFLKYIISKFRNPLLIFKIPGMIGNLYKNIGTNLSAWDLLNLMLEFKELDVKNMRLFQLPGSPKGSYWMVDGERTCSIIKLMNSSQTPVDMKGLGERELQDMCREDIKIEIFNASSYDGMAKYVTDVLRAEGFDVVWWGNAEQIYNKTIIVDRTGNIAPAQQVGKIINKSEVISRIDTSRMVDISLYLGKDFDNIN